MTWIGGACGLWSIGLGSTLSSDWWVGLKWAAWAGLGTIINWWVGLEWAAWVISSD